MLSDREKEKYRARLKPHGTVKDHKTEIGMKIKAAREKTDLSQEDVAELLGVEVRTIRRHENGETICSFEQLMDYCDLYECQMDDLLPDEMIPYLSLMDRIDPAALKTLQLVIGKTLTRTA